MPTLPDDARKHAIASIKRYFLEASTRVAHWPTGSVRRVSRG
jgi:hypothetical protein